MSKHSTIWLAAFLLGLVSRAISDNEWSVAVLAISIILAVVNFVTEMTE